jgi:hypothetical protein
MGKNPAFSSRRKGRRARGRKRRRSERGRGCGSAEWGIKAAAAAWDEGEGGGRRRSGGVERLSERGEQFVGREGVLRLSGTSQGRFWKITSMSVNSGRREVFYWIYWINIFIFGTTFFSSGPTICSSVQFRSFCSVQFR